MRALLYKDLVVNRGTILTYLALTVVISLIPSPRVDVALPLAITLVLPVAYLQQEHKEKWLQLAAVLPYSPWAVVGARYLEAALLCLWMGACYGLGQALSRPRPGLGACLAAGALAVAILLALHAVALPLLYAFGPGEILPALLATLGLAAVVSWLALSIDEAAFFGLAGHPLPLLGAGAALFLVSLPVAVGRYARRGW